MSSTSLWPSFYCEHHDLIINNTAVPNRPRTLIYRRIFMKLINNDCPICLDAVLSDRDEDAPNTAMMQSIDDAIYHKRLDCFKVLLKHASIRHLDLNEPTAENEVPIIFASWYPLDPVSTSAEFVRALIDYRPLIDLNAKSAGTRFPTGRTPLIHVCRRGGRDMLRLLLSTSDRVNINAVVDDGGESALHLAGNDPDMVKDLLKAGIDKNIKDKYGKTAAEYAKLYDWSDIAEMITSFEEKCKVECFTPTTVKVESDVKENIERTAGEENKMENDMTDVKQQFDKLSHSQVDAQPQPSPVKIVCMLCRAIEQSGDILLQPCNHLGICASCCVKAKSETIFKCPKCKNNVEHFTQIHL